MRQACDRYFPAGTRGLCHDQRSMIMSDANGIRASL